MNSGGLGQTDRHWNDWESVLINLNLQFMYERNVDASKSITALSAKQILCCQCYLHLNKPLSHWHLKNTFRFMRRPFCFLTLLIKSYWEDELNCISLIWYKVSSVSQSHAMRLALYLFSFRRMNLRSVWSMEGWINRLIETVLPVTLSPRFTVTSMLGGSCIARHV